MVSGRAVGDGSRSGEISAALQAVFRRVLSQVFQRPYPADYVQQGTAIPFWETGLQFLTLNSCWQIDEFNRKRAGLLPEAVAHAIKQAQKQEEDARKTGKLQAGKPLLRIAVWHHAVAGPEQMKDVDFLGNLQKNGVRIGATRRRA